MSLSLRKITARAASAVSIMALCVLSPLGAIAGGASSVGVAGSGGGTEASLSYDPFAGDVDRQINIRELELEALRLEVEVAAAELNVAELEVLWAEIQAALLVPTILSGAMVIAGAASVGAYVGTEAILILEPRVIEWIFSD